MVPIRDEWRMRLLLRKVSQRIVLVALLAGCGAETPVPESGPAPSAPGGTLVLGVDALAIGEALPTADLERAFRALESDGVEVGRIRNQAVDVLVLILDLRRVEPAVIGANLEGARGVTEVSASARSGMRVVVGSSFVSQLNSLSPVGLLRIEGREMNAIQAHGYRRVLGVRPDGLSVVGHRAYHADMFDSALQVGPGVVEEGLLDITERDLQRTRYLRSFVATCGTRALAGISLIPVHLFSLGQALIEFSTSRELGCDEVVNLAGDREAVLGLTDGKRLAYFGHPLTSKVALITFSERGPDAH